MASGDVSTGEEPFYTQDERMLLQALVPQHAMRAEVQALQQQALEGADYLQQLRKGIRSEIGVVPERGNVAVAAPMDPTVASALYGDDGVTNPRGGFAFPALGSIIGAIAPTLIDQGIKFIGSLFKKKDRVQGSGPFVPNARGVLVKGGRKRFMRDNIEDMITNEMAIRETRGTRFWRQMLGLVHEYLVQALTEADIPEAKAKIAAKVVIKHMIPEGFQRFVSKVDTEAEEKPEGSGGDKPETTQLRSVIRPIVEWVVLDAADGKAERRAVRQAVDEHLTRYDGRYAPDGGSKEGIKTFWEKVKKIAKKIGSIVLPALSGIAKEAVPSLLKRSISKFNIKDNENSWTNLANEVAEEKSIPAPTANGGRIMARSRLTPDTPATPGSTRSPWLAHIQPMRRPGPDASEEERKRFSQYLAECRRAKKEYEASGGVVPPRKPRKKKEEVVEEEAAAAAAPTGGKKAVYRIDLTDF